MNVASPAVMPVPIKTERRKAKRGVFQNFLTRWKLFLRPDYFVQCPCPECGGMVSIRECMVQGETYWFCTESSRKQFEATH